MHYLVSLHLLVQSHRALELNSEHFGFNTRRFLAAAINIPIKIQNFVLEAAPDTHVHNSYIYKSYLNLLSGT